MMFEIRKVLEDIYKRRRPKYIKLFGVGDSLETLYNWLYSSLEELGFSDPRTTAIELLDNVDLDLKYGEIKQELAGLIRVFSHEEIQPEFEELREKERRIKELEKELREVKKPEDLFVIKHELKIIKDKLDSLEKKVDTGPVVSKLLELEHAISKLGIHFEPYYEIPEFEIPHFISDVLSHLKENNMLGIVGYEELHGFVVYINKLFNSKFSVVVGYYTEINLGCIDSKFSYSSACIGDYSFIPAYVIVLVTKNPEKYDYPGYVVARFSHVGREYQLSALASSQSPDISFRNLHTLEDMRDVYLSLLKFILWADSDRGKEYFKFRRIVDLLFEAREKYFVKLDDCDKFRRLYAKDIILLPDFSKLTGIMTENPTNYNIKEYRILSNTDLYNIVLKYKK